MSADAKLWTDDHGHTWQSTHDGECQWTHEPGTLATVLREVEDCMRRNMRWEIRTYPDGTTGLVGWEL